MKNKRFLFSGMICSLALAVCGCSKTYEIKSDDSDSKVQITLDSKKIGNNLHFSYVGDKIDAGVVNEDGSISFYSEEEKKKQIDELGRENTLKIVEENGLKINYNAHPDDDLSSLPDDYDEYIYTVGDNNNNGIATVHILMNEDAFKNRLQQIKDEYVREGMDIYSDGVNVQVLPLRADVPYGDVEMKWIPEAKKGYMIEIASPDYSFEDISCSIDLKKEIDSEEEYQEVQKSKEEMAEYIVDVTREASEIEKRIPQDNIAAIILPLYDEDGYLIDGVLLYDEDGNIVNISEDTEHKWCYDEKGWIVRADTVDVPYTLSDIGVNGTRCGDLIPIKIK